MHSLPYKKKLEKWKTFFKFLQKSEKIDHAKKKSKFCENLQKGEIICAQRFQDWISIFSVLNEIRKHTKKLFVWKTKGTYIPQIFIMLDFSHNISSNNFLLFKVNFVSSHFF